VTEPQEPRGATPTHLTSEELSECAFSPETAAAGLLEHAEGCAQCSAELADLRSLLTELAALPEPELPESVGIRLDAAVARAWQEFDAEQEAAAESAAATGARRGRRPSWRRIAIPLGSLSLIALAVVGIGALAHQSTTSSSASSSGVSAGAPESYGAVTETSIGAWVHSLLSTASADAATNNGPHLAPHLDQPKCANANVPQRSGYTVLTTSQRIYQGQAATLVVYQDAKEPASATVYAVVYAGSCPNSASRILAQGSVSR